jgi:hypothetical protein
MTDDPAAIPVAGSLSAKIIRACPKHKQCALECPERKVEDLGEIASFDTTRSPRDQSILDRLKEAYYQWHHSSQTSEKP